MPCYIQTFKGNCQYCVSGGSDRSIRLWNPHKGYQIKEYKGHGYEVLDVEM